jgi:hypothetical protein
MNTETTKASILRRALQANGLFSALSGLTFIFAAKPLATLIGVSMPEILIGIGIALLGYAAGLFRNARREPINHTEAWIAVSLDMAWVAGSVVVIFAGVLTTTGNWIVAIVADIVLLFGLLQLWGLRRLRQQRLI